MELSDALRTTGAVRKFTGQMVSDEVIFEVLDNARFAPSGGNRQGWRVIVVKDEGQRRGVRDLYLDAWHDYMAHVLAGLIPFSPLASDADRANALTHLDAAVATSKPDGFPETFDAVPVMLVVCADLSALAATDRDLDRYNLTGGASIFPFVWNILLAAHDRELGGVITTVATRHEPEMRELLSIPSEQAVVAVVALGYPEKRHTKLRRRRVDEFTTVDSFDGSPFTQR